MAPRPSRGICARASCTTSSSALIPSISVKPGPNEPGKLFTRSPDLKHRTRKARAVPRGRGTVGPEIQCCLEAAGHEAVLVRPCLREPTFRRGDSPLPLLDLSEAKIPGPIRRAGRRSRDIGRACPGREARKSRRHHGLKIAGLTRSRTDIGPRTRPFFVGNFPGINVGNQGNIAIN